MNKAIEMPWQPYREPLRTTLVRTSLIAVGVGAVLSAVFGAGVRGWGVNAILVLWPALGGHWVEVFFLNGVRPRIARARWVQVIVRLAVWFAGGVLLWAAMRWSAPLLLGAGPRRWPAWWVGGVGFIGVELIAHVALALSGRNSVYNGRG